MEAKHLQNFLNNPRTFIFNNTCTMNKICPNFKQLNLFTMDAYVKSHFDKGQNKTMTQRSSLIWFLILGSEMKNTTAKVSHTPVSNLSCFLFLFITLIKLLFNPV